MKNLKKLTLAEKEILTPSKMKQIRGGSGISGGCNGAGTSGTYGQNYKCICHTPDNRFEETFRWYGCYDSGPYGGTWYNDDIYNFCGSYSLGWCERN